MSHQVVVGTVLAAVLGVFLGGFAAFVLRARRRGLPRVADAARRAPSVIASRLMIHYVLWLVTPLERALVAGGVTPAMITIAGLAASLAAGVGAAVGWFGAAAALYLVSGVLDVLDGRVARRTGRTSTAGAFLDSVADRWAEFFVIGGVAFALPGHLGLAASLLCLTGSQMVSYTRARAEGLGIELKGGFMQRPERVVIVGVALLVAWYGQASGAFAATHALALAFALVGALAAGTALHRLRWGVQALVAREVARLPAQPLAQPLSVPLLLAAREVLSRRASSP